MGLCACHSPAAFVLSTLLFFLLVKCSTIVFELDLLDGMCDTSVCVFEEKAQQQKFTAIQINQTSMHAGIMVTLVL